MELLLTFRETVSAETCTYLGVLIGSDDMCEMGWKRTRKTGTPIGPSGLA